MCTQPFWSCWVQGKCIEQSLRLVRTWELVDIMSLAGAGRSNSILSTVVPDFQRNQSHSSRRHGCVTFLVFHSSCSISDWLPSLSLSSVFFSRAFLLIPFKSSEEVCDPDSKRILVHFEMALGHISFKFYDSYLTVNCANCCWLVFCWYFGSQICRARYWYSHSVRLSVCLSHVSIVLQGTDEYRKLIARRRKCASALQLFEKPHLNRLVRDEWPWMSLKVIGNGGIW